MALEPEKKDISYQYDVYRMVSGMEGMSFEKLLNDRLSFTVDRGVMVPVLKMDAESGKCVFIRDDGRCSIHNIRPGICRLFPMGRLYENAGFYYFLQKDECPYPNKTKVKLKNWLNTPEIQRYEKYISDWHYFIRDIQEYMKTVGRTFDDLKRSRSSQIPRKPSSKQT